MRLAVHDLIEQLKSLPQSSLIDFHQLDEDRKWIKRDRLDLEVSGDTVNFYMYDDKNLNT